MRHRAPKRRFRPFTAILMLALVAGAIMYLRCGEDFGLGGGGGKGDGDAERGGPAGEKADEPGGGTEPGKGTDAEEVRPAVGAAAKQRCKLRLDAGGLTLDGKASNAEEAVTACKPAGAELTVTGDAVFGERERLREALEQGGVEVFVREGAAPEK